MKLPSMTEIEIREPENNRYARAESKMRTDGVGVTVTL
jgi:hypothetical protein